MIVVTPDFSDIKQIVALINADPAHLVPRTEDEIEVQLSQWRVIKVDRQVIACGCFDYFSPRIAEVRSVIVHPDHRGRGYADLIMQVLTQMALPNQQVFVVTATPDFFRRHNFSECLGEKYILFYKHVIKS